MDLVDTIKEYWTIIFFIGSLIVFMAGAHTRINRLEENQKKMNERIAKHKEATDAKFNEMNPIWADIRERLVSIEITLEYIKKSK